MSALKPQKTRNYSEYYKKFEYLFDGTIGMLNTAPVDLELNDDGKPVWSRPYPVPRVHKAMFRKEVEILVRLVVLKEANDSQWEAPSFVHPKEKTNRIIFLSDFQNLNRQLKRKPYPMPKYVKYYYNLRILNMLRR